MSTPTSLKARLTRFEGGVAQFILFAIGGAAGDLVTTGVKVDTDRLVQAVLVTMHADGYPTAALDITEEFYATYPKNGIKADDTLNNTGGTASTGKMVICLVSREKP